MATYTVFVDKDITEWCKENNTILHREDGPVVEYANGIKEWFKEDKELSEAEFNQQLNKSSCDGKVVEIDGKKYRLNEIK